MRHLISEWRSQGKRVALVPTMGALHDGHLSLVKQAHKHADHVVVSIFVNPTQFGPGEDYEQYPRTLSRDVELCRQEDVSLVFAPDFTGMYGQAEQKRQQYLSYRITKMNEYLCAPLRPGHFEGVLQVVNKLFNIIQPDVAVFGQKDIQQWFIIRQMVEDLDHPIEILMGPTGREPDGLARSSRNVYLTGHERKIAPMLFESLQRVRSRLEKLVSSHLEQLYRNAGKLQNKQDIRQVTGQEVKQAVPQELQELELQEDYVEEPASSPEYKTRGVERRQVAVGEDIISEEIKRLAESGFNVEYFSLVTTPDLQPTDAIETGRSYVIAVAARLGKTRLIDNVLFSLKELQNHDA